MRAQIQGDLMAKCKGTASSGGLEMERKVLVRQKRKHVRINALEPGERKGVREGKPTTLGSEDTRPWIAML